ncbi:MAG: ornithine cyclodeaminase family protein [Phycicoccus sp.]|nr:ornithine cyclodeaminase family protein [Phycicoccus sp.]
MSEALLLLNGTDLDGLVSMEAAIESQRAAFTGLATGAAILGDRVLLPGNDASVAFSYAARMSATSAPVTKFGSVVPANRERGLPSVAAIVVVLDAVTGRPAAVLDGEAVTNLRTVAATALAVDALAPDARRIAILGWGAQGRRHAEVISTRLKADRVTVFAPSLSEASLAASSQGVHGEVRWASSARACVADADVVITCTTSATPLIEEAWLADARLVATVGSFSPERREVAPDVVHGRRVVVDHVPTALRQYGPVVHELGSGDLDAAALVGLGEVLTGEATIPPDARVLYGSVGVGIQDAAVVDLIIDAARAAGRGTTLPW